MSMTPGNGVLDEQVEPLVPVRKNGHRLSQVIELPEVSGTAASRPSRRKLTLGLVWQFKWLALGMAVLIAIPGGIAAWMLNPPKYEAKASVEVSPIIPRLVYDTENNGPIPLYQQYLNNQVSIIRSPEVLNRVLDHPEVQQTSWYGQTPAPLVGNAPSKLERLARELSAKVRTGTGFVEVRMETLKPEEAALIVNTAIDEYLKLVYDKSQAFDDERYRKIAQEYKALRDSIEGRKSVIAELRGDLLIATPEELQAQQRQRLDANTAELENLQMRLAIAQYKHDQLKRIADQEGPLPANDPIHYVADSEWARLFGEVRRAQHRLNSTIETLGESHYRVAEVRRAVDAARDDLEMREKQLDELARSGLATQTMQEGSIENQLASLEMHIGELKFEEQRRVADLTRERERVERTASKAETLAKELSDLHAAEESFALVRERKRAMEIERQAPVSIQRLDHAFAPTQPSNGGRRMMLVALAVAAGLGCGVVSAYARAATIPAVQQYGDVAGSVQAPLLGHVPFMRHPDGARESSMQAECIRMVRTALLERIHDGQNCAIQITSAGAAAGKTSVATLLADSLARSGKRVLLIDADLRHPCIHERLNLPRRPGLVELLKGQISADEAMALHEPTGVTIIQAGSFEDDDDPELLGGKALREHLKEWKEQFDLVLFDSAPLLPVADARILSRRLEGSVMVVREDHCRQNDVVDALGRLNAVGGSLLGVVFFSRRAGSGYYGYGGYGYGYGYGPRRRNVMDVREVNGAEAVS